MLGKTDTRGFSLWDVLVVVLVIGVLAIAVGPRIFGDVTQSEIATAKVQLKELGKAVEQFHQDVGRYPSDDEGLAVLRVKPEGEARWRGPYLQSDDLLTDPWGVAYQYHSPPSQAKTHFDLFSFGKDRTLGGVGDNVDIAYGE
ncbi:MULTISPECIES: type II secretion system major pseudopilin GspG [unclassified Pseudomonas]|uniref:type II secretion system major pseudopilin GspG n=1 Tax=unclassified Pseudomonas TaxID=196821 RepID=UPI0015A465BE|nr:MULTISPECIES: type II secretion system major pseudopilin GspG [unclassified Pseudomonas]NWC96459.1 type II secretion system major pseudopilin GspG [Pseudomonas sp. IPO3779]NWD20969.1 type II secretion system major pseudopilin GspG [Pseudomonas sp. IPO3778]